MERVRPVRVLIVDDHAAFRSAAAAMLRAAGSVVVGAVGRGEDVSDAVAEHHPDLVLLDIQLPGIDGVDVAEELARLDDPPSVVLTSSRESAAGDPRVRAAPVLGFVAKRDLGPASLEALLA